MNNMYPIVQTTFNWIFCYSHPKHPNRHRAKTRREKRKDYRGQETGRLDLEEVFFSEKRTRNYGWKGSRRVGLKERISYGT